MNKKQRYLTLTDCPCNTCIVAAICKDACSEEVMWYRRLSAVDKLEYLRSGSHKLNSALIKESFPHFVR